MTPSFLQTYLQAFHRIDGWFSYDASLLFLAYAQLNAGHGISGDVLEIGVYQGLSAITVAHLRGAARRMTAIDMFETRVTDAAYGSGETYRQLFENNMRAFHEPLDFLDIVTGASGELKANDFSRTFSFCHVDGGHSPQETFADLEFASQILIPGGILALDDYFNPQYPGVCEGAIQFMQQRGGIVKPVAIGYNKVLFQKLPAQVDLNAEFLKVFPYVSRLDSAPMWDTPVHLFGVPFRYAFDLYASTPQRLVQLGSAGARATFAPQRSHLSARVGESVTVPVVVKNTSQEIFPERKNVLGLSYHLLSDDGKTIQHDNARTPLPSSLRPGQHAQVDLKIEAPAAKGRYQLEIDLVWEGVMWFKDVGNPPGLIQLEVK
jgi:hypothetical protein